MTVREMGKLGGLARAAKCTPEELSAIGRRGHASMIAKYSAAQRRRFLRRHGRPRPRLTEKKIVRLKELFKSGWTQTQIAETLGVSRPTIRRYLHGYRRHKTVK